MRSTDFLANEVTINYTRTKRDNIIEYSLMLSLNIHHWSLPTKTTYIGNQPTLNALQVQIHFSKLFKKKSMEPFYSVKKLNISHIQVIKNKKKGNKKKEKEKVYGVVLYCQATDVEFYFVVDADTAILVTF